VRIANSYANSYSNSDRDGYAQLHAWLVCRRASPDAWRALGWRLFPGQREVL